jgi:hypothetical protein
MYCHLDQTDFKFLKGLEFSNSYVLNVKNKIPLQERITFLESFFLAKNVIHFGCVDHLPLIDEKVREGTWLHSRLASVSNRIVGIDINRVGIDVVNSMGYTSFCIDVIKDSIPEKILDSNWDYIFLGEILEHLDNPQLFLKSIHEKFSSSGAKLIVTVPNSSNLSNFSNSIRGKETVNSDHRFWFSPVTISRLLFASGFIPEYFTLLQENYSKSRFYKVLLLKHFPLLRDKIFIVSGFSQ